MSGMKIKNSIFEEEKEQFPWDENALEAFKKLIKDEGIKCLMDDIFLLGFLRATKFDVQNSLQFLKDYYNARVSYPHYFKDFLPSKLEHVLDMNSMQFLPKPDQDGSFVYVFRFANWDTSVGDGTDLLRVVLLLMDLQLTLHRTQVKEIVCIVDAAGITLSHLYHLSPRVVMALAILILGDSYVMQIKALHYVNVNVILKAFLSILIPLLPDKVKKRIHFHSDTSTLSEFFSPDCLPSEYGGSLPPVDPTAANKMIKANEDFYRRNEEYIKFYEETNKNFDEATLRQNDPKMKEFLEKAEEKFQCHSNDPEALFDCLKGDSKFDFDNF